MTPLEQRLIRRIAINGPMTIAQYMSACMAEPDGYYAQREAFGAAGDFVTAPDVSQMFGELVGAWLLHRWHADGAPAPVDLVELGPGRGTLMADALRVIARDRAFMAASRLVLVEASERLRRIQHERLSALHARIEWADAVPSEYPIYLIANEFFDALPIRQFVRNNGRWFERTVGLDGGALSLGLSPFPAALSADGPDGAVREMRPSGEAVAGAIGAALSRHGAGAAWIADYGDVAGMGGDTLQAVRAHRFAGLLEKPGQTDISAHVDFGALSQAAEKAGAKVFGPVDQGEFLIRIGLLERAGQLGADKHQDARSDIQAAVQRLAGTGPGDMGALFKIVAWTAGGAAPLGFTDTAS